jgi:hypothetical protein
LDCQAGTAVASQSALDLGVAGHQFGAERLFFFNIPQWVNNNMSSHGQLEEVWCHVPLEKGGA